MRILGEIAVRHRINLRDDGRRPDRRLLIQLLYIHSDESAREVSEVGAVLVRQIHIRCFVVSFVNGQTDGIGVMAPVGAARGGVERLRQLRAGGAVSEDRRKHARDQPARSVALSFGSTSPAFNSC
jgi:hypothetical protein